MRVYSRFYTAPVSVVASSKIIPRISHAGGFGALKGGALKTMVFIEEDLVLEAGKGAAEIDGVDIGLRVIQGT